MLPPPPPRIVALAVLAVAIIAGAVALDLSSVAAQSEDEQSGRIVARRLDDGRTEFGWQPAGGARVLPRARYFPADAQVGRWLNSSPVEVEGEAIGRINARLLDDGRIEFAFTPTDGERIEPPARYFPVDARVGRWLRSTEIAIGAAPATGFVAVAAGHYYTCGLRTSGAIECWGSNTDGQAEPPAGSFTTVATGRRHMCAIRESDSAIECWGSNTDGQADPPTGSFSAVAAGGSWYSGHACAIRVESDAIECWGSNGTPVTLENSSYLEIAQTWQADPPAGSFTAVSASYAHTCGLRTSGAIECWGSGYGDQYVVPITPPPGRFSAISAGRHHTCAIHTGSGVIECWGSNDYGQLDDIPTGRFIAVSASYAHTCGLRDTGAIECWGRNRYGQTDAPAGSFTAVSAGGGHTCGLRSDGAIECWGSNTRSVWDWETEVWEEVYSGQIDAPTQ